MATSRRRPTGAPRKTRRNAPSPDQLSLLGIMAEGEAGPAPAPTPTAAAEPPRSAARPALLVPPAPGAEALTPALPFPTGRGGEALTLDLVETAPSRASNPASSFRPSCQDDLAPSGLRARVDANLRALAVVRALRDEQRPATPEEQQILARWSAWGAVPMVFDESRPEWALAREQLRSLLDEVAYAAARRTTINAHYTDPAYVREMWAALTRLGFTRGRVLEPGCGAGTFIGMAPAGAELYGVELDPTSAAIAAALYPHATVRAESFADTRLPDGTFDAAIGNVPFGSVRLRDPVHNPGNHSLHTHFILKSLALTRPGGLVALLTSRYTLDSQRPEGRRALAAMADLLGAVRLPSGAHARAAGTDVVTDVLILRRREPGHDPGEIEWEETTPAVLGSDLRVNAYFDANPWHVLGTLAEGQREHGSPELDVRPHERPVAEALAEALGQITEDATRTGSVFVPRAAAAEEPSALDLPDAADDLWDGHLTAHPQGWFTRVEMGRHKPRKVPRPQRAELRALLDLRDKTLALLDAESTSTEDTIAIQRLRVAARAAYHRYREKYGPINRYTLRPTGRTDTATGEPAMARIAPPVMRILREDPHAPLVFALESFDETTQQAVPAPLLSRRTLAAREPVERVDEPEAALALCMETYGEVRLDYIAKLLATTSEEARVALGELVFDEPVEQRLVPAAEYLSGNVRRKLAAALTALDLHPEFAVNVEALEKVQPNDLGADEVEPRLGAVWIDVGTHQEFLREILDDEHLVVESPGGGVWAVDGDPRSVAATSEWGTERMPATVLARTLLEQRAVEVHDCVKEPDGTKHYILNPDETAAAAEKAEALHERFSEWCWEDPERASRLLAEYNWRFNAVRLRDYTVEGERLTLPGLAKWFTPLPHQRAAVARMLSEPAVGLFHEVGAGKTAEMVMGCMELRRLGMVSKPAVVVPNHMLEQFTREWLQLYPQTRLLAASVHDLAKDRRRAFVARIATNDWDAILMTRTAFERLPVRPETAADYLAQERDALQAALAVAEDGQGRTVKRIERALIRAEEAIEKRLKARVDPGLCFEATGIDYLGVDEAHEYKNLRTFSNIQDAAIEGSNRASDLHLKIEYLRSRHGRRVATLMTATPIANSITEAHVMLRLGRPDLLEDAGVLPFDSWAATFGRLVSEVEMAPSCGGQYRLKTRFARFQNVPEMLRIWSVFADVRTEEDLNLPTPLIRRRADGQRAPETVVIPASPEIERFIVALGGRAEAIRARLVRPDEDNMLMVSTDGRKAALDMRLIDGVPSSTTCKLDVVAENIAAEWRANRENEYLDPVTGEPSPTRGALQLVFCDLGTPSDGWNAYHELRWLLVDHGLPRESIRFIHEAKTDVHKGRLFAAARAGHIAVLIGSTNKMGVGTNVQARCVALHHVDCPWRPADVRQRDGRGLRQGNQNEEVAVYRYVVEGSFDAYMWQTIERKARFIAQVMRGSLDVREIDDIGDSALSFAEVKALASGDPLILEKATADAERVRLERLQRSHRRDQQSLVFRRGSAQRRRESCEHSVALLRRALDACRDTRGELFEMTVGGERVRDRARAAALIYRWVKARAAQEPIGRREDSLLGEMGELGGLRIDASFFTPLGVRHRAASFGFHELPVRPASLRLDEFGENAGSIVRQLEHRLRDLPAITREIEAEGQDAAREMARAEEGIGQPFKHAEALAAAEARCAAIDEQMQRQSGAQEHPHSQATSGAGLSVVDGDGVVDAEPSTKDEAADAAPAGLREAA
jgi:N12 class adenine-specific DNA methylase